MKAEIARIIDSRWPVIEWLSRATPRWKRRLAWWVIAMRDEPPPAPHTWLYRLLWIIYNHTRAGRIHRASLGLIFDLYPDHVTITFPERPTQ